MYRQLIAHTGIRVVHISVLWPIIKKIKTESKSLEMSTEETNTFNEIYIKGQTYKDVLSKRDVWKELERIYNGSLKASTTKSGDVATLTLEIQYKNYKLVLIETDTKPLKIEVNFNLTNKFEFEFNIYLKDWTDKISSFFGIKSTKTGEIEFDTKYGIQSKESELTVKILNDNHITEKILENDLYSMILNYDETTKSHKLLTVKDRNTTEITTLTKLIDLEFRIIDSFIKHGQINN